MLILKIKNVNLKKNSLHQVNSLNAVGRLLYCYQKSSWFK